MPIFGCGGRNASLDDIAVSAVEWTDPAIADLRDIDDYWSAYDTASAERVAALIEAASGFLATMPRAGPALRRSDARKWLVGATPYLLIYRVLEDGIQILRVHHGRQDWDAD